MRPLPLALALLLSACAAADDTERAGQESTCDTGLRIHGDALASARDKAPACRSHDDCVVMKETVGCEGLIKIDLCDLSVHRLVVEYYDSQAVARALCEATESNGLGCTISASCAAHGQPVCRAGECTFDEPS